MKIILAVFWRLMRSLSALLWLTAPYAVSPCIGLALGEVVGNHLTGFYILGKKYRERIYELFDSVLK